MDTVLTLHISELVLIHCSIIVAQACILHVRLWRLVRLLIFLFCLLALALCRFRVVLGACSWVSADR